MKLRKWIIVLLTVGMVLALIACDSSDYKKATALFEEQNYEEARAMFVQLGDYEDSADYVVKCDYQIAICLFNAKNYSEAEAMFAQLGSYEDSKTYLSKCYYEMAQQKLASKAFDEAIALFQRAGTYSNSDEMIQECKYQKAVQYYADKDYANAVVLFGELSGYKDSDELRKEADQAYMLDHYADTLKLLEDSGVWFYNGGSDLELSGISFSGLTANLDSAYFDGNGIHMRETVTVPFSLNDTTIFIEPEGQDVITIPYQIKGGAVRVGSGEFLSYTDVEEGLQGYWTCRYYSQGLFGGNFATETNILIEKGKIYYEKANEGYNLRKGQYYFSEKSGTYTLRFGQISSSSVSWIFFNIIDGKPVVLEFTRVHSRGTRLPGQNGYKF